MGRMDIAIEGKDPESQAANATIDRQATFKYIKHGNTFHDSADKVKTLSKCKQVTW